MIYSKINHCLYDLKGSNFETFNNIFSYNTFIIMSYDPIYELLIFC